MARIWIDWSVYLMINFAFGLLVGYLMGIVVGYYVSKIDKDIKNGRG